jgi:HSP20 family molecular chaperone IbpA
MQPTLHIPTEILQQIDLYNTVGGGISLTSERYIQKEHEDILEIYTPGFGVANYGIEIHGNKLQIIRKIKLGEQYLPFQFRVMTIPYYVDLNSIYVEEFNGVIKVVLPKRLEDLYMNKKLI